MVSELRNFAHHSIIETVRIYITATSLLRRWSGGIVVSVPDFGYTGMGEFESYMEWIFFMTKLCVLAFFLTKIFKMLKLIVLSFFSL